MKRNSLLIIENRKWKCKFSSRKNYRNKTNNNKSNIKRLAYRGSFQIPRQIKKAWPITRTMLAMGKYDFGCPYSAWERYLTNFNDITFQVFDYSGHVPQTEEADKFDSLVLNWIERKK